MKTIKITYRQMVAEFLLFLKKNNALNGYRNAVKEYRRSHFKTIENIINPFTIEPIKVLFKPEEYRELIDLAFYWRATPEGHAYWEELDQKWRKMIGDNKFQMVNEKIYKQ